MSFDWGRLQARSTGPPESTRPLFAFLAASTPRKRTARVTAHSKPIRHRQKKGPLAKEPTRSPSSQCELRSVEDEDDCGAVKERLRRHSGLRPCRLRTRTSRERSYSYIGPPKGSKPRPSRTPASPASRDVIDGPRQFIPRSGRRTHELTGEQNRSHESRTTHIEDP